jgi:N-acetylmuramoyl-L-alanine amidase
MLFTAALIVMIAGCNTPTKKPTPPVQVRETQKYHPPESKPVNQSEAEEKVPTPQSGAATLSGITIVVDAGHGGKDPGASFRPYGQMLEKAINLDMARRLKRALDEMGATVIMTRNSDEFIELEERAEISNRAKADLFISLHTDSHKNRQYSGITIYIEPNASSRTVRISHQMFQSLKSSGFECFDIREKNLNVLRNNRRSAILVECGFLTNRQDAKQLNDEDYRQRLAAGLARGIAACLGGRR